MRSRLIAVLVSTGLVAGAGVAGAGAPALRSARPAVALEAVPGLPAGVPAAARRVEPTLSAPHGWPFPEAFPRTSGAGRLAGGASYWADFLYDDHGATGFPAAAAPTTLAPTDGSYGYPDAAAHANGADIFRAAVGLDRAASYWRVDWNTLADPKQPIAEWALDTDGSTQTGVADWPAGAGVRSPGLERGLVVSSRGAWLLDARSGKPVADLSRGLTVDTPARSFVVRIPRSVLPVNGTSRVRLAAGLANADGTAFRQLTTAEGRLPGQPNVYNLAFRSVRQEPQQFNHGNGNTNSAGTGALTRAADGGNYWMEDHQAYSLSRNDAAPFALDLRWSDLARRAATPEPVVKGYSNRWYVSQLDLGQGVDLSQSDDLKPNYLGRVQPYAVYVPTGYEPGVPMPLTWILHSLTVNHNQYGALDPRQIQQTCEDRRSICATTLGRGPDGWYFDEAEVDFWEVWNRLAHSYSLDPTRTVLSGFSMGGYGSYKLGLAYPDVFAKSMPLAGPPTCGLRVYGPVRGAATAGGRCDLDGDTLPLVGNARHLPYVLADGVIDELVPYTSVQQQVQAFDSRGYRYHFESYPAEGHNDFAAQDAFGLPISQLGRTTVEEAPAKVDYTWFPHLTRGDYGIGPTGAYWLRDLVATSAAPGFLAHVVAHSTALAEPLVTVVKSTTADPTADPSPVVTTEQSWQRTGYAAIGSSLELTLTGVRSVRVDGARAGLFRFRAITVALTSATPAVVTVSGLQPGTMVHVTGGASVRADRSGTAVMHAG